MKKLLVFTSLIFLLSACEQQIKYSDIPDNMKPLLVNNDTVYFLDSFNNRIDTFRLHVWQYYDVSDNLYYHDCIDIHYSILNKSASLGLSIQQIVTSVNLSISGHYFSQSIGINDKNTDNIKNNVSIHGVIYPTVYVLQGYDFPDSIPQKVYYTFKNGIIRYDYKDGRKYELMNK